MNKKKILALLLVAGFGLTGCGEGRSEEGAIAEAKLKATCDELTKADDEGRVYEIILGRIAKDKITGSTKQSSAGASSIWKIVFIDERNNQIPLKSERIKGAKLIEENSQHFDQIVSEKLKEKNFNAYQYGVCAYKKQDDEYLFLMESLTLMKKKE